MRVAHRSGAVHRTATAAASLALAMTGAACTPAPEAPPPGDRPPAHASGLGDAGTPTPASDAGPEGRGPRHPSEDDVSTALDALDAQDIARADLAGELACGFLRDDGTAMLHATGFVASDAPARGIVKLSGVVEPVEAPGGFDGLVAAPVFRGRGMTIDIVPTGPATAGGESPPRPATLVFLAADGPHREIRGSWQCGP